MTAAGRCAAMTGVHFSRGSLTRDGEIAAFRADSPASGGDPVAVIPMAITGLWGSMFLAGHAKICSACRQNSGIEGGERRGSCPAGQGVPESYATRVRALYGRRLLGRVPPAGLPCRRLVRWGGSSARGSLGRGLRIVVARDWRVRSLRLLGIRMNSVSRERIPTLLDAAWFNGLAVSGFAALPGYLSSRVEAARKHAARWPQTLSGTELI